MSRYKGGLDPVQDWVDIKKKKGLLLGIISIISLSCMFLLQTISRGCYTSWEGEGIEDFVLTSCPAAPKNITEMSRVGESFQDLWEKYQGIG
jgi:hypothetical protein